MMCKVLRGQVTGSLQATQTHTGLISMGAYIQTYCRGSFEMDRQCSIDVQKGLRKTDELIHVKREYVQTWCTYSQRVFEGSTFLLQTKMEPLLILYYSLVNSNDYIHIDLSILSIWIPFYYKLPFSPSFNFACCMQSYQESKSWSSSGRPTEVDAVRLLLFHNVS